MSDIAQLEAVKDRRGSTFSPLEDADFAPAQEAAPKERTDEGAGPAVPGMDGRPCWRVLEDWTDPGDGSAKLRPGVWYFGLKAGKGDAPPILTQTHVCGPLYVIAETTNAAGANFGRLLRFRTTRKSWKTWAMPMTLLASDGAELRQELLYMGLEIDPQARHLLPQYLQHRTPKRRILCMEQTGWAGGGLTAFVLPELVIGPDADAVVFQSGEHSSEEFTMGGTLEGWRELIAAPAVGNPVLVLALCTAFAGPVLARCNAESGGVHLVGGTSSGKSTSIEAARSVWGGPGFKRSWRTTANGLEGVAALFNDCLLALDEISECEPREVGGIVYSLGNGKGKQRAGRTGSARQVKSWRCSVLSSGEKTVETTMAEGGHRIKAGQSVRLLDVPVSRAHGSFDTLHSHASGQALSDSIKRAANQHFGHAGRAFLERLAWDNTDLCEALEEMRGLPEFKPDEEATGQVQRAANRFALLALAGELATAYGVTGWQAGEAIAAAGEGFKAWLSLRTNPKKSPEHLQIVARVGEFIERHGDSRFSDADNPLPPERAAMIRDRAGWHRQGPNGRQYLFTSTGLREALKGFDFNSALDVLISAGVLIVPTGQGGVKSKPERIDGQKLRVYIIDADALAEANGEG